MDMHTAFCYLASVYATAQHCVQLGTECDDLAGRALLLIQSSGRLGSCCIVFLGSGLGRLREHSKALEDLSVSR